MSKADTINALMSSALQSFERHGFEGASLREIAMNAGVPLSTIDRYFGSKVELFGAVAFQLWAELERERNQLLQEVLAVSPQAPPLDSLIRAFAFPVVRRALSDSPVDVAAVRLVYSHLKQDMHGLKLDVYENSYRSLARWMNAVSLARPMLSYEDVVWAWSYVVGVIYSPELIHGRYDRLLEKKVEQTPEAVTEDIVAFCSAGIDAYIRRRVPGAQ